MISLIKNLIKRAVVSGEIPDTGNFSTAQVKWASDKVGDVQVITPWGFYSKAPKGSLALMFNIMGHEENRAAIIDNPAKRFRGLKPGEVFIGNPLTGSVVRFMANGDINITGKASQNITITGDSNLTVGGNTTITTAGNTTINTSGNMSATIGGTLTANVTGNTDITSPVVTVHGALRITGEITAFYGTGGALSFTTLESKYNSHTHVSAAPGVATSTSSNTLP